MRPFNMRQSFVALWRPGREYEADGGERATFIPATDVCETPDAYEVRLELAGIDTGQVDIVVAQDDRTVTVSGTRFAARVGADTRYLNLEIGYGAFARQVTLPRAVDRDAASASYQDGFLVIHLPKRRPSASKRVTVERG